MYPINEATLDEETYNVPYEKPQSDPMFFYRGVVFGSLFSLLLWAIIIWAII